MNQNNYKLISQNKNNFIKFLNFKNFDNFSISFLDLIFEKILIEKSTKFKDLKIIYHLFHNDRRGFFRETFQKKKFFQKKNLSLLVFHLQKKILRIICIYKQNLHKENICLFLKGEIFDVAVDLRNNSKNFWKIF